MIPPTAFGNDMLKIWTGTQKVFNCLFFIKLVCICEEDDDVSCCIFSKEFLNHLHCIFLFLCESNQPYHYKEHMGTRSREGDALSNLYQGLLL
ncbi:hypothetical protein J4Q44_G00042610 [Coregonus suidteri]|uniref:Uncharacterized protein n=1 Tax=Coregonus suidteri TaxID=861788 RepID=A0AAN8R652_9TELE